MTWTIRWLALAVTASVLVLVTESATDWRSPLGAPTAVAAPVGPPVPYPPDYRTALADADRALATASERASRNAGWLAEEMLARAHFERARLTGSLADYEAAEQALERSTALAPPGSGPHLLQAAFDLSVHRLSRAEAQLDRIDRYAIRPAAHEQAEMAAMRGDIAFYRGRNHEAIRHYDQADRVSPGSAGFRRAYHHSATGDRQRALSVLDRAERESGRRSSQLAARTELQRGIFALEQNDIVRARAHFLRADALFPGDWLIGEHIAETLAMSGHREEARRRYRDIVGRTNAPEYMDELARLARESGDPLESRRWTVRADAIWQRRLERFPEAFYAQVADRCLAARDFACAVRLARLNFRSRPYGEAAALLAEVLQGAGQKREARRIFQTVQRSGWRSPRTRRIASSLMAPI